MNVKNLKTIIVTFVLLLFSQSGYAIRTHISRLEISNLKIYCEYTNNISYTYDSLFINGKYIRSLEIPSGVTKIGKGAFNGIKFLTVIMGSNVESIGDDAFSSPVKTIWLGNTVPTGYKQVLGTVNYVSNKYDPDGDSIPKSELYASLSSNFVVDDIRYVPVDMANRTCDVIDCLYDEDSKPVLNIGSTVTYKNVTFTVNKIRRYSCILKEFANTESNVSNSGFIGSYAFYGCSMGPLNVSNKGTIDNYAFKCCTGITKAKIANSSYIGFEAFSNEQSYMDSLVVACSGEIRYGAFMNSKINEIAEIKNKGSIAEKAFYNVSGSFTVDIQCKDSLGISSFSNCTQMKGAIVGDEVKKIKDYAFYGCTSMVSLSLGENIAFIGDSTCYNCLSLLKVAIPDSVKELGESCFMNCKKLNCLTIGRGIKKIDVSTFRNCSSLPKVIIPKETTKITNYVFDGCTNLSVVIFEKGNYTLTIYSCGSDPMFSDCPLDSVYIGRNLSYSETSINGLSPFYKNTTLKKVTFANVDAGNYEFMNCSSLYQVIGVSEVGNFAFNNCTSLKKIEVSGSLGNDSFGGCTALTYINLRNTVTIGDRAFQECTALPSITIPKSVTNINNAVFHYCYSLKFVDIKQSSNSLMLGYNWSSSTGTGQGLFYDCHLDSVFIGRNLSYSTNGTYGYSPFSHNSYLRSVEIRGNANNVPENAFYNCSGLKFVRLGNTVKTAKKWAFSGCTSLDYFYCGLYMASFGDNAFSDCANMTKFICQAVTPPTCGTQALDDINKWNCTLIVQSAGLDAYKKADQWKNFLFAEAGRVFLPTKAQMVDLGLPSGTLWADMNVGADASDETGYYFAWGETEVKSEYTWATYKWCQGTDSTLTKYNSDSKRGTVDNLTQLELDDDAAYTYWGPDWQTPTMAQLTELIDKCTFKSAILNDVIGYRITGPNGNSIFIPKTKYMVGSSVGTDSYDYYWTNELTDGKNAYDININSTPIVGKNQRYYGFTIRPVASKIVSRVEISEKNLTLVIGNSTTLTAVTNLSDDNIIWSSSNANIATVNGGKITAVGVGSAYIIATSSKNSNLADTCSLEVTNICVNGIYYAVTSTTDKTVAVTYSTNKGNSYSGDVVIPSTVTINGMEYNVTSISDSAFYKSTELTSLTISNNIVKIGNHAFYKCM